MKNVADELLIDKFAFKCTNDLVVPYEGAGTFDPAIQKYATGVYDYKGEAIYHLNFFKDENVRAALLKCLSKT